MMKAIAIAVLISCSLGAQENTKPPESRITKVVMLGTGNPAPIPDKMGASVAIVVNGTPYLVDAGVGVVRRASGATRAGVKGLEMPKLRRVFITHLHSDHTLGLPDLIFTPWVIGRDVPLEVYGPKGIAAMTNHILQAWSEDNEIRITGLEKGNPTGNKVNAHEIDAGVVYQDSNVKVTAFRVPHGSWKEALGYRFETPDRVIVISGDESPGEEIVKQCNRCDMLLHEVYSALSYKSRGPEWSSYLDKFHTSTDQLADIAIKAKPKTLVLYHQMYFGDSTDTDARMVREINSKWKGRVIASKDLDIY